MSGGFIRIYEVRNQEQQSFRVRLPRARRDLDQHIFNAVRSNAYNFQRCSCRNGQTCERCAPVDIPRVTIDLADAIETALSGFEHGGNAPRVSNDVSVIPEYKADETLDDECSICFDKIKKRQKFRALPCSNVKQHCFHTKCIDQWLKNNTSCPVCRAEVL